MSECNIRRMAEDARRAARELASASGAETMAAPGHFRRESRGSASNNFSTPASSRPNFAAF